MTAGEPERRGELADRGERGLGGATSTRSAGRPATEHRPRTSTRRITPLFERSYDAVGFFGHAAETTGDLAPHPEDPEGRERGRQQHRLQGAGGDGDGFLNSWGASVDVRPEYRPRLDDASAGPAAEGRSLRRSAIPLFAESTPSTPSAYTLSQLRIDPRRRTREQAAPPRPDRRSPGSATTAGSTRPTCPTRVLPEGECKCPPGTEGQPAARAAARKPILASSPSPAGSAGAARTVTACRSTSTARRRRRTHRRRRRRPADRRRRRWRRRRRLRRAAAARSNGDPHLTTFDGVATTSRPPASSRSSLAARRPRGAGPRRSRTRARRVVDQHGGRDARRPRPGRRLPGLAARGPRQRQLARLAARAARRSAAAGRSARSGRAEVEVRWPDGSLVPRLVGRAVGGRAASFKPVEARGAESSPGLLGDFDGNGGERLRAPAPARKLSRAPYGRAQRATGALPHLRRQLAHPPGESLFDYARGQIDADVHEAPVPDPALACRPTCRRPSAAAPRRSAAG